MLGRRASHREAPKNFGGPIRVVVMTLAVFIASQFLAALIVSLILKITDPGSNLSDLADSTPVQFAYVAVAETLVALLVIRIIKNRGLNLAAIGFSRKPKLSDLGRALIGLGVFYALLIGVGLAMELLLPGFKTDQPQDVGFDNIKTTTDQVLAFAALVFFAPIAEEILVRGYMYSGLRASLKFIPAMLTTSLIFASAHLPGDNLIVWGAAINTFVLSIVLVHLREKTGALYSSILLHGFNNLVAFAVLMH